MEEGWICIIDKDGDEQVLPISQIFLETVSNSSNQTQSHCVHLVKNNHYWWVKKRQFEMLRDYLTGAREDYRPIDE